MPGVLTTGSKVFCGHGGLANVSGSQKLRVNSQPVLVKDGIAGRTVSGCLTVPDPSDPTAKACTTVSSVSGVATKLTIGGRAVGLDTLTGATDGAVKKVTPQLTLAASGGQNRLTAR